MEKVELRGFVREMGRSVGLASLGPPYKRPELNVENLSCIGRAGSVAVNELREKERLGKVTLIYAAHDEEHSGALALKQFLSRNKPRPRTAGRR